MYLLITAAFITAYVWWSQKQITDLDGDTPTPQEKISPEVYVIHEQAVQHAKDVCLKYNPGKQFARMACVSRTDTAYTLGCIPSSYKVGDSYVDEFKNVYNVTQIL